MFGFSKFMQCLTKEFDRMDMVKEVFKFNDKYSYDYIYRYDSWESWENWECIFVDVSDIPGYKTGDELYIIYDPIEEAFNICSRLHNYSYVSAYISGEDLIEKYEQIQTLRCYFVKFENKMGGEHFFITQRYNILGHNAEGVKESLLQVIAGFKDVILKARDALDPIEEAMKPPDRWR